MNIRWWLTDGTNKQNKQKNKIEDIEEEKQVREKC